MLTDNKSKGLPLIRSTVLAQILKLSDQLGAVHLQQPAKSGANMSGRQSKSTHAKYNQNQYDAALDHLLLVSNLQKLV